MTFTHSSFSLTALTIALASITSLSLAAPGAQATKDTRLFVRHQTHCQQFLGGEGMTNDALTAEFSQSVSQALAGYPSGTPGQRMALLAEACRQAHPRLAP